MNDFIKKQLVNVLLKSLSELVNMSFQKFIKWFNFKYSVRSSEVIKIRKRFLINESFVNEFELR